MAKLKKIHGHPLPYAHANHKTMNPTVSQSMDSKLSSLLDSLLSPHGFESHPFLLKASAMLRQTMPRNSLLINSK
jgi:hypothetical protein